MPKPAKRMLQPRQIDMLDWLEVQNGPQKPASESLAAFRLRT
jgi:hypothetical protein